LSQICKGEIFRARRIRCWNHKRMTRLLQA
jgi:hypothetical protein